MLSDNERKVLQVFINLMWKRTPTVAEICTKTRKSKETVVVALNSLHDKGFIWRDSKGQLQARREHELDRPKPAPPQRPHQSRHADWW